MQCMQCMKCMHCHVCIDNKITYIVLAGLRFNVGTSFPAFGSMDVSGFDGISALAAVFFLRDSVNSDSESNCHQPNHATPCCTHEHVHARMC